MSVCHFSLDCDVYIFADAENRYLCYDALYLPIDEESKTPIKCFVAYDAKEMIYHLIERLQKGYKVPKYVFDEFIEMLVQPETFDKLFDEG